MTLSFLEISVPQFYYIYIYTLSFYFISVVTFVVIFYFFCLIFYNIIFILITNIEFHL